MADGPARPRRAHRLTRLLAASAVVAGATTALVAAPAGAAPGDGAWARTVRTSLSRHDLGLPKGASDAKLGAAAIERSARRLLHGRELGGLRFVGEPLAARGSLHALRFQQRLGGLRVLWSEYDVAVARGEVTSISGTVLPLRSTRLTGKVKLTAARAKAIASGVVPGDDAINQAQLVAYAGSPDKPRPARRAFVVDVTPAAATAASADATSDVCVVVDAQTGKVLTTWRGFAAPKPQRTSKAASAAGVTAHAAALTTTVQVDDAQFTSKITTNSRRELATTGSPYGFASSSIPTFGGPFTAAFDRGFSTAVDVARFFCRQRNFCGRDGGQPGPVGGGTFNRAFWTLQWTGGGANPAEYHHNEERIVVAPSATDSPNVMAHEFGHQIDTRFRNDHIDTLEALEVDEALADMFAIDYEQGFIRGGATRPTTTELVGDPGQFRNPVTGGDYPQKMSSYQCNNGGDLHLNGLILSIAYLRMTRSLGYQKAGLVLQGVPWALPAARTFGSVRTAFEQVAGWNFGVSSNDVTKVRTAFDSVGVTASSNRGSRGC